jgi:AraC family transcriptional activator of pyochelin receptor
LEKSVTISVTRDLLLNTLNLDPADAPSAVRAYSEGVRAPFAVQGFPLPPRLRATLHEILTPPTLRSLYTLYLQARVYDLLWLTLDHLRSLEMPVPSRIKLSPRDKDCINEVRLLLERNMQNNTSMTELCRRFGINRNKLNYGFKLLFGTSPASYFSTTRLDFAKRRLRNSDRPIAVIAEEIGYRQQSTFSSAFKRHFGVSPRDIRR